MRFLQCPFTLFVLQPQTVLYISTKPSANPVELERLKRLTRLGVFRMLEAQDNTVATWFTACNNTCCSEKFKYLDWVAHSKVDGPDPRDHFANERNLLAWLRTGVTLAVIGSITESPVYISLPPHISYFPGFMTLLDLRSKTFALSYSLPWTSDPVPTKTKIVAFVFIGLGFASILVSIFIYFKNQRQILRRLLTVGHGWAGYSMALLIMLFVCFVMIVALTEVN